MKRQVHRLLFLTMAALFSVATIQAQNSLSIGVINSSLFQAEKDGITKLIALQKQIQEEFKPRQQEIQDLQKKLETLRQQINSFSGDAYKKKLEEGERLQRDLNTKSENLNAQASKRYNDLMTPLQLKVGGIIEEWCQKKGYDMLIDISKDEKMMILWMRETAITATTNELIKYINSIL